MSIKIWEAYRLRSGYDLWEALHEIRIRAERTMRKRLTMTFDALIAESALPPSRRTTVPADVTQTWHYFDAHRFVLDQYRAQLPSNLDSGWNLDISLVVRRTSGKRHILVPYIGRGILNNALTFLRRYPPLEDYHYQNQTDPPGDVSPQAWRARSRTWAPLLEDDRWPDCLHLDIMSIERFHQVSPAFELERRAASKAAR